MENCTDAINIFNAAKNFVLSGTGQILPIDLMLIH
jgi:hypothetical protein